MKIFLYQLAQLISDELVKHKEKEEDVSLYFFPDKPDGIKNDEDVHCLCEELSESISSDFESLEAGDSQYPGVFYFLDSYENFKRDHGQDAVIQAFLENYKK